MLKPLPKSGDAMALLDYFRKSKPASAAQAKDRLSIIVAHEHRGRGRLTYLPQLKQELLQVLAKYEKIDLDQVSVNVEHNGTCEVLELNVTLSGTDSSRERRTPEPAFFTPRPAMVRGS
jgi:cell division topological specificity factor